jgi:hypothetical protein
MQKPMAICCSKKSSSNSGSTNRSHGSGRYMICDILCYQTTPKVNSCIVYIEDGSDMPAWVIHVACHIHFQQVSPAKAPCMDGASLVTLIPCLTGTSPPRQEVCSSMGRRWHGQIQYWSMEKGPLVHICRKMGKLNRQQGILPNVPLENATRVAIIPGLGTTRLHAGCKP